MHSKGGRNKIRYVFKIQNITNCTLFAYVPFMACFIDKQLM